MFQSQSLKIGARDTGGPTEESEIMKSAIRAISSYGNYYKPPQNLFKHAITSRKPRIVELVRDLISKNFRGEEV